MKYSIKEKTRFNKNVDQQVQELNETLGGRGVRREDQLFRQNPEEEVENYREQTNEVTKHTGRGIGKGLRGMGG